MPWGPLLAQRQRFARRPGAIALFTLAALLCFAFAGAAASSASAAPAKADAPQVLGQPSEPLLREASDYRRQGKADVALRLFADTCGQRGAARDRLEQCPWHPAEADLLAQLWIDKGDYQAARSLLQPLAQAKLPPAELLLTLAEVEAQVGNHADRHKLLLRACQLHPKHIGLRVALGEQLYQLGKAVEARKLLDPIADVYQAGGLKTTAELVAAGRSLQLNGYPKDALAVLGAAEEGAESDGEKADVALAFGLLYLEKYNYRDADRSLRQVLALQPKQLAARVALGRIDLLSDHDVARARKRLGEVLADNPRYLAALQLRAEIALFDEDLQEADRLIQIAQSQRPDDLGVLRVRGAWCKLSDDAACWTRTEQAVRKINKDDGELYLVTAGYLEMAHRYREVKLLLDTAIERQPELWQAHAALGMALARQADDAGAQRALEAAYAGDPYDVRTANQLSILYDDGLKHMVLLPGTRADVRLQKRERKALERAVVPFVQEAVDQLDGLYKFTTQRPLQVEIFADRQQFSVRTVGLPQLGAHAVCFGHLVTSRSPMAEPFNWKMVLYHELSHVVHIQATGGRVPRWLTEGLAMMESAWADPRWRPSDERRAWDRLQEGKLAKIAQFNLAFSQARSMQDILDAYDQAMRTVEFLAEVYGRDKVRQLALAHQPGKRTNQLIEQVYAKTPEELDREFAAWLGVKLGRFAKDFRPSAQAIEARLAPPAVKPEASAKPDPPAAASDAPDGAEPEDPQAESGQAPPPPPAAAKGEATTAGLRESLGRAAKALRRGQGRTAKTALTAIAEAKAPPDAWWEVCAAQSLLLELSVTGGDKAGAKKYAQALVKAEGGRCDGVRQRAVLSALAQAEKQPAEAADHLRGMLAIDSRSTAAAAQALELAGLAIAALAQPSQEPAATWLRALAPQGEGQFRSLIAGWAQLQEHDSAGPELLGRAAWWAWREKPASQASAAADLQRAWQWLEERQPAGRHAALFEARAAVAAGKPATALAPYRLAAERASSPAERAEAWCEAVEAAQKARLAAEQAEAERRCAADRPPAPGSSAADRQLPKPAVAPGP